MKKRLKDLYNSLKTACTTFTFIIFVVYLIANMFGKTEYPLVISSIPWVFLISLWFALSNLIFKIKKFDPIVRTLIHFVAYTLGFYFVAYVISKNANNGPKAFVFTIVFATLYVIAASAVFLILHFMNRKKNDKENYTPTFGNDKTKK